MKAPDERLDDLASLHDDYARRPGADLRLLLGQYTAGGHVFGSRMVCLLCTLSFAGHQADPKRCPNENDFRPPEQEPKPAEPEEDDEGIRQRIRSARELRGVNVFQLAAAVGFESGSTIWRYERGTRRCRGPHLYRLAEGLGVDFDWLRTGRGPAPA